MPEYGLALLLTVQLAASIVAAIAWWRAARDETSRTISFAAYTTCAWFALLAGCIAYLFDTDLVSLSLFR